VLAPPRHAPPRRRSIGEDRAHDSFESPLAAHWPTATRGQPRRRLTNHHRDIRPRRAGTPRIDYRDVLDWLAGGRGEPGIADDCPPFERDAIRTALTFATDREQRPIANGAAWSETTPRAGGP
jgi:uncharacterized protein (DUF433 family)